MATKTGLLSAVLSLLIGVLATMPTGVEPLGVCYGLLADDLPKSSDVVKLYKKYGITAMRIYAPNAEVLHALVDTGIVLMMGVDDGQLEHFANNKSVAVKWVQNNVVAYPGVSFKYIVVGNEVHTDKIDNVLPAMNKIWDALSAAGFEGKIKVSTAVSSSVFTNTYPPSDSKFNASYNMEPIVEFLVNTGNPLFANIYPYFAYKDNPSQINLNYALLEPTDAPVTDGSYQYHNLFDAMLDSVYYALEKVGGASVDVVVTESGWPSAGGVAVVTTTENARKYNQNLINHVSSGTPKKPISVETYIFAMFNERNKTGDEVERHFGLFYPNQTPVYSINFSSSAKESTVNASMFSVLSILHLFIQYCIVHLLFSNAELVGSAFSCFC